MRCLALCLTLSLAALQTMALPLAAQGAPRSDTYLAIGSESMESTFLLWADAYKVKTPSFRIDLRAEGSGVGAKALLEGKAHLAPMSREMKAEEVSAFTAKWGYAPSRIAVAMDALVIIVHKSNPIKEIKVEQLDAVWSSTRLQGWPKDILTWGELGVGGGNWSSRPNGSGTRDFFREAVELGGKGKADTKRGVDAMSMVEEILTNQAAMGYGSMGEIFNSIRTIPIVPKGGKSAVEATPATVLDGSYPLARVLYIYVNKAPGKPMDPVLAGFLRFVLSKEGQSQVQLNGQVPLSDDIVAMNLRRIGQ